MNSSKKKPTPKSLLRELNLDTPKLTKEYTQKLIVLLNSKDHNYKDKRKNLNNLVIEYDNDLNVKLTNPNEKCLSLDSRNQQAKQMVPNSPCGIKSTKSVSIIDKHNDFNKRRLNIPEFCVNDVFQVKEEVRNELEDYYQLNSKENDYDDYTDRVDSNKGDKMLLYNKLKQQHKISNRINMLLTNSSSSKVGNLPGGASVVPMLKYVQLRSPHLVLSPKKVLFKCNRANFKGEKEGYKSQSLSHLIHDEITRRIIFGPYQSNKDLISKEEKEDFSKVINTNKKELPSLTRQDILNKMRNQNEVLFGLAQQCRLSDSKALVKLRSTKSLTRKMSKINRS